MPGRCPTAIFAANDQLALGLFHAFTEAGVRVPQDVSVVGFDDIAGSAHFSPPLTTVRQEFADLGRACLRMLRAAIAGEPVGAEVIEPHLVVRASTAAARTGRGASARPPLRSVEPAPARAEEWTGPVAGRPGGV